MMNPKPLKNTNLKYYTEPKCNIESLNNIYIKSAKLYFRPPTHAFW